MAPREEWNYKHFVKEAKNRLTTNGYQKVNRAGLGNKVYVLNSKVLTSEELYAYYKKVSELVESNEVGGAIGELIDFTVYERLSPPERERYVLVLGKIYRDMKTEIFNSRVEEVRG